MRQCSCRFISTRRQAESTAGLQARPLTPRSDRPFQAWLHHVRGPNNAFSFYLYAAWNNMGVPALHKLERQLKYCLVYKYGARDRVLARCLKTCRPLLGKF